MTDGQVKIERLVSGGYGLGYLNKRVVLVPFSAPGDKLLVEIIASTKGVQWGKVRQILEPSPLRTTPFCTYYTKCGGCQLQHILYPAQLECKTLMVTDCLKRIAGLKEVKINPCIPSPLQKAYRNRVRLHWDRKGKGLGFCKPNSNEVVLIKECPVLPDEINACLRQLSIVLHKHPIKELQEIQFMQGSNSEVLLTLNVKHFPKSKSIGKRLKAKISAAGANICSPNQEQTLWGKNETFIQINNWKFKATNGAFFQANTSLLPGIVEYILKNIKVENINIGLELYSGVGLFSIPLSGKLQSLFAVEWNNKAVQDAFTNLSANQVTNTVIQPLNVNTGFALLNEGNIKPDLILVDPPRDGLPKGICGKLRHLAPKQIIYISCNPSTLARDIKALMASDNYGITDIQPFDMFPHTSHVETIVNLVRKV